MEEQALSPPIPDLSLELETMEEALFITLTLLPTSLSLILTGMLTLMSAALTLLTLGLTPTLMVAFALTLTVSLTLDKIFLDLWLPIFLPLVLLPPDLFLQLEEFLLLLLLLLLLQGNLLAPFTMKVVSLQNLHLIKPSPKSPLMAEMRSG